MTTEWVGIGLAIVLAACGGITTFVITSEKTKRNADDIARVEATLGSDVRDLKGSIRRIWDEQREQGKAIAGIAAKLGVGDD